MQVWSQLAIKITVLNVYCQEMSFEKTEYQYRNKRYMFKDSFEVVVNSLHDLLFGKVKIILSANDSRWMASSELAGAVVDLRSFFESNIDYGEYKLIGANDLYVADFFGRRTSLLGKICLGFEVRPLNAGLVENNPNNVAKRIMRTIFSGDMMNSLLDINDIFSILLDGSPLCNLKNLVGTFLIDALYNNKVKSCGKNHSYQQGCFEQGCLRGYIMIDRESAGRIKRIAQYSAASFLDSIVFNLMMKRQRDVKGINDPNLKAILDRADVEEKNVLKYYDGDCDMVGFVMFLEGSRIIVSFRGTLTKNDIIHDLNTCYVPFLHGYAHSGIKNLAENFLKREWSNVEDQMKSRNIKKLLITGYSLGAAVGTMFHLVLCDKQYDSVYDIETVVFSPPPTVSRNIANANIGNITTYNYGNDIIPRISLGALLDFKYICISLMTDFNIFGDIGSLADKCSKIIEHLEKNDIHPKLYHPGTVVHVKGKTEKNHTIYRFKTVSPEFFADFSSPKNFPHDHMLNTLITAFDYILQLSEHDEDPMLVNGETTCLG